MGQGRGRARSRRPTLRRGWDELEPVLRRPAVRGRSQNLGMGFVADPDDPSPEELAWQAEVEEERRIDALFLREDLEDDDDEDDDEGEVVEWAPRRSAPAAPSIEGGPRTRRVSMAPGAGQFADEPGGFAFSSWRGRGSTARAPQLSAVAYARIVSLLEAKSGGLSIDQLRGLMRRGRRTPAATRHHGRLAAAVHELREHRSAGSRPIRVDHLAHVLGCDPATIWRLKKRGASAQLQDSAEP